MTIPVPAGAQARSPASVRSNVGRSVRGDQHDRRGTGLRLARSIRDRGTRPVADPVALDRVGRHRRGEGEVRPAIHDLPACRLDRRPEDGRPHPSPARLGRRTGHGRRRGRPVGYACVSCRRRSWTARRSASRCIRPGTTRSISQGCSSPGRTRSRWIRARWNGRTSHARSAASRAASASDRARPGAEVRRRQRRPVRARAAPDAPDTNDSSDRNGCVTDASDQSKMTGPISPTITWLAPRSP